MAGDFKYYEGFKCIVPGSVVLVRQHPKGDGAFEAFFYGRFMNYYSHHIGDFDRATRHLTRIERSIYLDLMFTYYDTEQPLTADVAALCRKIVARTEEEKAAVLAILDEFFITTPSGWFHDRCEEELARFREAKSQASAAGKASAAARAERRRIAINGSPTGVERRLNETPTTVERPLNDRATEAQQKLNENPTNQEPITSNQEPEQKVKPIVPAKAVTVSVEAQLVFTYWQEKRGYAKAKLDAKRLKAISARLKDGYSVSDLCRAIDGIARSPHHMGENDRRTIYDDIELICRDGPKVDGFMKLAGAVPGLSPRLQHQVDVLNEWMSKP